MSPRDRPFSSPEAIASRRSSSETRSARATASRRSSSVWRLRRIVRIRATSCLTSLIRIALSSCPVADWNRRLNSSSLESSRRARSSSSGSSRSSAAFIPCYLPGPSCSSSSPRLTAGCRRARESALPARSARACYLPGPSCSFSPHDELCLHRQLVGRPLHGLPGHWLCHPGQLEHHPARLDHGHPSLGVALARPHAGLRGLLGDGLVGENVDPDLAAAPDVTGHGDTGSLDLAVG